jgi:hypothetical protein
MELKLPTGNILTVIYSIHHADEMWNRSMYVFCSATIVKAVLILQGNKITGTTIQ